MPLYNTEGALDLHLGDEVEFQVDSQGRLITTPRNKAGFAPGLATYSACGTGFAAYATPTDLLTIRGSATKTVVVLAMRIGVHTTSAALNTFHFIKRSAANTGGTSTNPAGVPHDSTSPAATAQLDLYTAAPTTGAAVGTITIAELLSATATGAAGMVGIDGTSSLQGAPQVGELALPIVLRGAAQSLCLNFQGAALAAGWTSYWLVRWAEF